MKHEQKQKRDVERKRPPRTAAVVGALTLVLGVPGVAAADPDVPDANLAAGVHTIDADGAVRTIDADGAVRTIDLSQSVLPLESEETSGAQVTLRISADVLFDFNKSSLTPAAKRRIGELAPRLRSATGTVQVSGHSDSVGSPAYNLALSRLRAEAVKAELQRVLGGAAVTITATGYGETRPVAPNKNGDKDDPGGRAKNRRVDITFQKS